MIYYNILMMDHDLKFKHTENETTKLQVKISIQYKNDK